MGFFFCCLLLCLLRPAPANPADTFQVTGAVAHSGVWFAGRVDKELPDAWKTVTYTLKGKRHTARAVALLGILNAARLHTNPRVKNDRLCMTVSIAGRDGYTVAFSLAELLPDVGKRNVWVAFTMDGNPLPQRDGPAMLLVPQDGRPGRWVHAIGLISVTRARQAR